jgi:tetratricopeptide (TPR) repeat protein
MALELRFSNQPFMAGGSMSSRNAAFATLLMVVTAPVGIPACAAAVPATTPNTSPTSSTPAAQQAATQAGPSDLDSLRRQGIGAYHQADYAGALQIFRQVITADPSDIVAYNISANCSMRLKDYPAAIDSFQHALQLRPDEHHNVSGLIRAFTLAGMTKERDELRKHISELEQAGKLPATFNYVFETFDVDDKKVEVAEFPKIQGFFGERYRFKVFNSAEKEVFCVVLESDAAEQPAWAREHPKEAASGGRKFSLDGYASDSHSTYGFYDGEPPYEQVRDEAKQILAGKKQATIKTKYSKPQPIPGEE